LFEGLATNLMVCATKSVATRPCSATRLLRSYTAHSQNDKRERELCEWGQGLPNESQETTNLILEDFHA